MAMAWLAAASFVLSVLALASAETEASTTAAPSDGPLVTVKQGALRGHILTRQDNSKIYAFEGIPYAKPPVGELRFKDPEEADPWRGERSAIAYGPNCLQLSLLNSSKLGEEDCLFINIYTMDTPDMWATTKRPVMFWIHGGAFVMGSGDVDAFYPDPYLKKNFLFVTINYRLGVFGFMNSEDSAAPGNAGLKDMVMALRWVKENIAQFGGDAEQVTITGLSAGGAAVHYLTISPMASGLFQKAIAFSGNAMATWAFLENPRAAAEALRARVQCDTSLDLIPCLQSVDGRVLVDSREQPIQENKVVFQFWKDLFVPSVEAPGSSAAPFLTQEPQILSNDTTAISVPFMTGITDSEGIMFLKFGGLKDDPSRWARMDESFLETFRDDMPQGMRSDVYVQRMREFYLGDRSLVNAMNDTETMRRFLQMLTDLNFGESMVRGVVGAAGRGAPVYLYQFSYDSPASAFIKLKFYQVPEIPGVAHGDDSQYIFYTKIPFSAADNAVKERHIDLVSNFMRTGNPTPDGSSYQTWPLFTPQNESYADIGRELIYKEHAFGERVAFWREMASSSHLTTSESQSEITSSTSPSTECHSDNENMIVRVQQGLLRGQRVDSINGGSFVSFQGIPYAKAPVDTLRFKGPEESEPWEGVYNAFTEGNMCPQAKLEPFVVVGNEDCLYLNVYTPHLPCGNSSNVNVMFWIHGGGFIEGSANKQLYGPDYLIDEGIILVTINYRLGPLGFLYLNEAAPGNVGLKDQVAALRWVKNNIAAFGGDPQKVTIFGESAGGVSVHCHMLSPMSNGLFSRAIAQSGSAIAPWAMQNTPAENARRLSRSLGCASGDDQATVDCLRTVNVTRLLHEAFTNASSEGDRGRLISIPFVPTVEMPTPEVETFLPAPPIQLIREGRHHAVPFLTGMNNNESVLYLGFINFLNETIAKDLDSRWNTFILPELRLALNETQRMELLNAMRNFYMQGNLITNDSAAGFMNLLADLTFGEGMYYSLRQMAKYNKAPIFLYNFIMDDELNYLKSVFHFSVLGAAHADELGYIFHNNDLPSVKPGSPAETTRSRMVRLWTNFAKYGNPTPEEDDPLLRVRWEPYTTGLRNYMQIGSELRPGVNLNAHREGFLQELYRNYSTMP